MYRVLIITRELLSDEYNENIEVIPHFKLREFACRDGSQVVIISETLLIYLRVFRAVYKMPTIITSAYRTVEYNKKIGGAPNSLHLTGDAVDLLLPGDKNDRNKMIDMVSKIFDVHSVNTKIGYIHCGVERINCMDHY